MPAPAQSERPTPEYLTVNEAAELCRCHPETIRRRVYDRSLPASRGIGRKVLIRRSDLDNLLEPR
jgi:excisionase family DNA binding protein